MTGPHVDASLRVFFDVDYTLLGQDLTLRPGAADVFARLVGDGHEIYVWSGFGERARDMARVGLAPHVSGYFRKPLSGLYLHHSAWGLSFRPDFVVDDHPGPVAYLGGLVVSAYVDRTTPDDGAMWRVYDAVRAQSTSSQNSTCRSEERAHAWT